MRNGAWIDLYLYELNILQSRKNVTKSWLEREEMNGIKTLTTEKQVSVQTFHLTTGSKMSKGGV